MTEADFSEQFQQDFYSQYEKLRKQRFEPALTTLTHNVGTLLDVRFGASPRLRLRVEAGRIKSANRLLLKAQLPKYRSRITKPDDVFLIIRDVIGTRITCNTVRDAYAVADAIKSVLNDPQPNRSFVSTYKDFEDDYIKKPKESGYRALSLLVGVPVAIGDHTEPVTCEIQIRTLLQHAWGELTHEDTYKPEMKTPPLIVILSRRLANALAVLDEIAQDIRDELDKLESEQANSIGGAESTTDSGGTNATTQGLPEIELQPVPVVQGEHPTQALVEASEPAAPLSEALRTAFRAVFGRDPVLNERQSARLVERFTELGLSETEEVQKILTVMADKVKPLEAAYSGSVVLNDYGRFMHSAAFAHDPDAGIAQIERSFKRSARIRKAMEEFETTFFPGKEVLGTVVHVASDYALVQLPEGVTGIIHVTAIKKSPREFLDLRALVTEGETVRVRIVNRDAANRRIELSLVRL